MTRPQAGKFQRTDEASLLALLRQRGCELTRDSQARAEDLLSGYRLGLDRRSRRFT